MFPIPFYIALLVSLPQNLLFCILGLNLVNIRKTNLLHLTIISSITAIVAFIIRKTNLPFGFHTFIDLVFLTILLHLFLKLNFVTSLISSLIGTFILAALEAVTLPILGFLGIDILNISNNPPMIFLCFLPILFASILLLFIIKKTNFHIIDLSSR